MSYFQNERKMVTREKRLSTLSNFNGTLDQLIKETEGSEIKQRIRTFSQVGKDEIFAAIQALSSIEHSAVVIHGVAGCAASNLYLNTEAPANVYSTNLQEKDTILGSDAKLNKAIAKIVKESNPKVVFIIGTPVVAINNDDVNSVIFELEDVFNIKLIFIYTDGFKTKSKLTGYDIVAHSLLQKVIKPSAPDSEKNVLLNIISFSESKKNIEAITSLLDQLEIKYNIFPRFSSVEDIEKAASAKASVVLNDEKGSYLAQELEDAYGVKYIKSDTPIGLLGTNEFLKNIASEFGKEEQVEKLISDNERDIQKAISQKILSGKKVFVDGYLADVLRFGNVIELLGGDVSGLSVTTVDLNNRKLLNKFHELSPLTQIIVGEGQYFEKANALSKIVPDFYLSQNGNVSFAAELNTDIQPISLTEITSFGYEGLFEIIDAFKHSRVFKWSKNSVYKDSWLKKSGNWYVKQETK